MARITFNKAYLGNNLIYKIDSSFIYMGDGDLPQRCPTVISTINGYTGGENEVYALDTQKYYELNNLGQYEEYGIMPTTNDLTSLTTYKGKLAILSTDYHEYEWTGSAWSDLGSAGSMITIKSPSYIYNDNNHKFSIPLNYSASTDSKYEMYVKCTSSTGGMLLAQYNTDDHDDYRIFFHEGKWYYDVIANRINSTSSTVNQNQHVQIGNYYIKNLDSGTNIITGTTISDFQRDSTLMLGMAHSHDGDSSALFQCSGLTMYHGETKSRDFIPAIDGNEVCLYDKISGQYFKSNNNVYPLSGGTIQDVEVGTITPVKEYDEKETIATAVTATTLSEIECPFEGLHATVDGVVYVYTSGEWVMQRPNTISGTVYNGVSSLNLTVNGATSAATVSNGEFNLTLENVNITSLENLLYQKTAATSVHLDIDTSNCTSMQRAFARATRLTAVTGIEHCDWSKTTNCMGVFNRASGLKSVNVSGLVTSACTTIDGCFYLAENIDTITGLDTWNTSNVTVFGGLFGYNKVTSLDLSTWDTSKVTDMVNCFINCTRLTTLDISGWDMTSASTRSMFSSCNVQNIYMNGCNNTTLTKIQNALSNKSACTIHRDGYKYNWNGSQWVATEDN